VHRQVGREKVFPQLVGPMIATRLCEPMIPFST